MTIKPFSGALASKASEPAGAAIHSLVLADTSIADPDQKRFYSHLVKSAEGHPPYETLEFTIADVVKTLKISVALATEIIDNGLRSQRIKYECDAYSGAKLGYILAAHLRPAAKGVGA